MKMLLYTSENEQIFPVSAHRWLSSLAGELGRFRQGRTQASVIASFFSVETGFLFSRAHSTRFPGAFLFPELAARELEKRSIV